MCPVDATSNSIQTTINAQKIELVPKSTGFTGLLKTVPGTRPESRTGGFSVDGASGGENVFVIDGQEVTNYRTGTLNEAYNVPTQLVQEVQVKLAVSMLSTVVRRVVWSALSPVPVETIITANLACNSKCRNSMVISVRS